MVGILCTVANESLKNQNSRASTPSDSNDSEGTEKGFDPEVILVNLREKLVTVPRNGRKPVFQLGPNGDKEEIIVLKEVCKVFLRFVFLALKIISFWYVDKVSI